MEAAPKPDGAREATPAKSELPTVESPPISPGSETPAIATDTPEPAIEPIVAAAPAIEPMRRPTPRRGRALSCGRATSAMPCLPPR